MPHFLNLFVQMLYNIIANQFYRAKNINLLKYKKNYPNINESNFKYIGGTTHFLLQMFVAQYSKSIALYTIHVF